MENVIILESHFPKLVTTVNEHVRVINSLFLRKKNFGKDFLKQKCSTWKPHMYYNEL